MRVPFNVSPSPLVRTEVQDGVWLDARLAVWFAAERLLVVADLHWGYAASHRARGNLLPWWGDDQIEARLRTLVSDYQPAEMIWLGDVVHAAEGGARAEAFVRTSMTPVTLIAGNHDRRWRSAGPKSATRGNYFFHHGDAALRGVEGSVEVVGHHHPAVAWWDGAGSNVKLPALVASAQRLVLPAFSPWASGTPWTSEAGTDETIWAVSPHRIFPVKPAMAPTARSA
jgi:uncharacterized protein